MLPSDRPVYSTTQWSPALTGYYSIDLAGHKFAVQSATKAWSLSAPDSRTVRFEVRDGDQHSWDAEAGHLSERSELADRTTIDNGTPIHISYDLNIEPGARNSAYFLVLGQLHQDLKPGAPPWSPPFAISLKGERMMIAIRYSDADGKPVTHELFVDSQDIQRGHFYDIDIRTVIDPGGAGRLVVERDGVVLVDYSGPLGYIQHNGVYWAQGVYRHSNATETFAASYRDLAIETGGAVTFPEGNTFIAAPVLTVDNVADSGESRVATLLGSAKPETTVTVMDAGQLVGTASVAADGRFELVVKLGSAAVHGLTAVATDKTGRVGVTSAPVHVHVTTAADLVANIDQITQLGQIGAIVLTDDHVLTATTRVQLWTLLKQGAPTLAQIEGSFKIRLTETVSGQPFDRQDELYSSVGVLLERTRYADGKLVFDEDFNADGSQTVRTWNATKSELVELRDGRLATTLTFDLADRLTLRQIYYADGSREVQSFDPITGAQTRLVTIGVDLTRTEIEYGIKGKAYATQTFVRDTSNKIILQQRHDANGTKILEAHWHADGSSETHHYDGFGRETSYSIRLADGSRIEGRLQIAGQPHTTERLTYSAADQLMERDRFDALGHQVYEQVFLDDGVQKFYVFDGAGQRVGYTLLAVDRSSVVATFAPGQEDSLRSVSTYDTAGRLVRKTSHDETGSLIKTEIRASDGTYSVVYDQFPTGSTSLTVKVQEGVPEVNVLAPVVTGSYIHAIVGGADAAHFTIDAATGRVSFRASSSPDFERPGDANGDGIYDIVVRATGDGGRIIDRAFSVVVENVNEAATGTVRVSTKVDGSLLVLAASHDLVDPDALGASVAWRWQASTDDATWTDIVGATSSTLASNPAYAGKLVRAVATYADPFGVHNVASPDRGRLGTEGGDNLGGTTGRDVLAGQGGDDRLDGAGGDDTLFGGAGNDVILGDLGDDRLEGGGGQDMLFGEDGDDVLSGGSGNDILSGGDGA
ncbi:heparin lyase I family protein, partial [Methylorubrum aminovorans]